MDINDTNHLSYVYSKGFFNSGSVKVLERYKKQNLLYFYLQICNWTDLASFCPCSIWSKSSWFKLMYQLTIMKTRGNLNQLWKMSASHTLKEIIYISQSWEENCVNTSLTNTLHRHYVQFPGMKSNMLLRKQMLSQNPFGHCWRIQSLNMGPDLLKGLCV